MGPKDQIIMHYSFLLQSLDALTSTPDGALHTISPCVPPVSVQVGASESVSVSPDSLVTELGLTEI